ncbi:hypothetical protein BB559_007449 [Furculomyces boomerangus]|uniref:beta-N-acetylhexosaminidase n=2 Tax=Harpellales TaxID=61421 RepID=A0A2T9XXA3_9FUNG|nr:hypothetical protein BB559_007449 [Furculomyces boomerangus]PWA03419.1 hypothetical protein BB558_000413 [Smittium angustum]
MRSHTVLSVTIGLLAFSSAQKTADDYTIEDCATCGSVSCFVVKMTLQEKIAQKFLISVSSWGSTNPDQTCGTASSITTVPSDMAGMLGNFNFGGVSLAPTNVVSNDQIVQLNYDLQEANLAANLIPYYTYINEEGGYPLSLTQVTRLPGNMAIAGSNILANAASEGSIIGQEVGALGFNLNNAPVANVNRDIEGNQLIARTFSSDPAITASYAVQYFSAMKSQGVAASAKYFPTYGNDPTVATDYRVDQITSSNLAASDLIPFKALVDAGVDMITVSHVQYPNIDSSTTASGDVVPASMSKTIVTDILRNTLGYNGIVISDSNSNAALNAHTTKAEQVVGMFIAGVDIVNVPDLVNCAGQQTRYTNLIAAVEQAITDGEYSESDLNDSVIRILNNKKQNGLLSFDEDVAALKSNAASVVASQANQDKAYQMAVEAITLVKKGGPKPIPWGINSLSTVLVLTENSSENAEIVAYINQISPSTTVNVRNYNIAGSLNSAAFNTLVGANDATIFITQNKAAYPVLDGTGNIPTIGDPLANNLFAGPLYILGRSNSVGKPNVLISGRSPIDTSFYPGAQNVLAAYGTRFSGGIGKSTPNLKAALEAVFGVNPITGKLPIDVYDVAKTQIVYPKGSSAV